MLQNRIYRGEIVHNKQSYLGEHEPIINQPAVGGGPDPGCQTARNKPLTVEDLTEIA
jgi:hypothetical protein